MKGKLSAAMVLFAVSAFLSASQAAVLRLNPDAIDLNMDISKMTVEELRLHRNAIYARHCYWFEDGHLRGEFQDYQENKCGRDLYWKKPSKPFDSSVLTPEENRFVSRVKQREDELKNGQVRVVDGRPVYRREAVVNRSQFSTVPAPVMDRLFQNGFVAVPGKQEQLFQVYEENDYRMIPNFITADSLLQLYHLYFDFSLREIEEQHLLPAASILCRGMTEKLRTRYAQAKGTPLAGAVKTALLYFAVAEDLTLPLPGEKDAAAEEEEGAYLEGIKPVSSADRAEFNRPAPSWMEEGWKKDFLAQRRLILQAQAKVKGPIMGTVDYTMFKPRGHYTRSKKLARFFRTMMWLGLPGFLLEGKTMPPETALLLVYDLTHTPELWAKYALIYEPTTFYVGPTDDITPSLLRRTADELCGPAASLAQWLAEKEEILKEVIKRNPVRIKTQYGDDRDLPQLRVMGMRYVPDSEIFQRLIHLELRPLPTGLDLFGVMAVPAALEILKGSDIRWPDYWKELARLQAEFKDFRPARGESNLYWRWLHLLRTLNQPAPPGAAPFMRTRPWEHKNLNTALASWAELRHDTILYSKPFGAECDGGEPPPRVVGYVEARPDFWEELLNLQNFTSSRLREQDLLTERLDSTSEEITELLNFLLQVSRKEAAGQELTDDEYERIRVMGGYLEYLTIQVLTSFPLSWYEISGPDRFMAVVADIGTFRGLALEEAVGAADELYALVEIDGYLYLTRGAVFSYYEFTRPTAQRLTDEEWQKMLRANQAPPRPPWIQSFFLNLPVKSLPERYTYSSGG